MGRPRKQTVEYFPHYVNTDGRTRFVLEQRWGNDGYAFWFKLLELLGRTEGQAYDCSKKSDEIYLLALMKVDEPTAMEILDELAELGDIDKMLWKNGKIIWCQKLVDNLESVYNRRAASPPLKPKIQGGEMKQPKRNGPLPAKQMKLFEQFYAEYPKKVDRATAERAWARINPEPDEAMTQKIIRAVRQSKVHDSRFQDRKFIPNPASWLNAKGYLNEWEDDDNGRGFTPSE